MRKKKPQTIYQELKDSIFYYDEEDQQNLVMIPAPTLETFAGLVAKLCSKDVTDFGTTQHIRKSVSIAYDLWCESHLGLRRRGNVHYNKWSQDFNREHQLAEENQRIIEKSKIIAGQSVEFPLIFDDALKLIVTKKRSKSSREIAFTEYLKDSKVIVMEPEIRIDKLGRKMTVHTTKVEVEVALEHHKKHGFTRRHLCEYAADYAAWNAKNISKKRSKAGSKKNLSDY